MSKLREAAQAVIDRWDTPLWKDVPSTAEFIHALKAALEAEPQEPVSFLYKGIGDDMQSIPLYPAPRRELSDEEILKIADIINWPKAVVAEHCIVFARAILEASK